MDELDKLAATLERKAQKARQAQIRYAECVSVDWEARTMTAKGTADDLEYLDVALGLGAIYTKPAAGAVCLIGIIDGQEVSAFLIAAEKVELVEYAADSVTVNEGKNGGLVKAPALTTRLNAIEKDLNALKTVFSGWAVVANDGGGALKTAAAAWAGQQLEMTTQEGIENGKITH